jgi:hypothetical protein
MTDLCCGVLERPRRRCRRRVRAPAPGRGAAVVAATRPIPRHERAASRARGVPAGPPAAAPDPGPGGAGRRPRRPRGGRSQAGRPRALSTGVIPQESGSAAQAWRQIDAVLAPEGPSRGGSSASPSLSGQVAAPSRVDPLMLVPPAGGEGDTGREVPVPPGTEPSSQEAVGRSGLGPFGHGRPLARSGRCGRRSPLGRGVR